MADILHFPKRNKGRVCRSTGWKALGELTIIHELEGPIPDNVVMPSFANEQDAGRAHSGWDRLEAMMREHMSERFAVMALFMDDSFKLMPENRQSDLLKGIKRLAVQQHNELALNLYNHWSKGAGHG